MGGSALGHDRDTGASDRVTARDQGRSAAALQSALERLRLEGAVFLRAEYREPQKREMLIGMILENKVLDIIQAKAKIEEG